MPDLDERLNRACADGRITEHDAEEVRRFSEYLQAMADAGIRPARRGETRSPEAAARARAIYLEHYPEHAPRAERPCICQKEHREAGGYDADCPRHDPTFGAGR